VNYGGWDHHSGLLAGQQEMLPIVNDAVKAFYDTLAAIGAQDEIVLYSASDFGRSLTSNSQGSDHAWGGNQFAVGGQVKGRRIYFYFVKLGNQRAGSPLAAQAGSLRHGELNKVELLLSYLRK
jgi:uncharacterized protein (DUF1501 family)